MKRNKVIKETDQFVAAVGRALRRKGRAQDRPHARNTDLYLEEWQDRRRETVNKIAPDPVFPVKLFGVVIFCARAGQSK